tara:strand:- start:1046 stop:2113 length:1068 start_codon:yes stop_codon:yes gene_type:complete
MECRGNRWIFDGPAYSRLWEKSAIGTLLDGGGLALTDIEVIFCRQHRGVEFASIADQKTMLLWLNERISTNPSVLREYAVFEALRVPGNKVVISENFSEMGIDSSISWAFRWSSDKHPSKHEADSEVIWFSSDEPLNSGSGDWQSLEGLLNWSKEVYSKGRISEVLVIDEEHSVVTYRISESNPIGNLQPPELSELQRISTLESVEISSGGVFIIDGNNWKFDTIGLPLHGGRQLDNIEYEIVLSVANSETDKMSESANILFDLWNRGLSTRSGFKYGTKWRCYAGGVGEGHAPWLVVDSSSGGPKNWSEACLSSRLASGVNKEWLYPIMDDGKWRYLQISRPPSDSRWTNPIRH